MRSLSKRLKKRRFNNNSDASNSQSNTPRALTPSEDSRTRIATSPDPSTSSSSIRNGQSRLSNRSTYKPFTTLSHYNAPCYPYVDSTGALRAPVIDGVTSVSL